jgi:glycosyltransferase involved in cell wall biosynthesis
MKPSQRWRVAMLIDHLGMGGAERLLVTYLKRFDFGRFDPRVCVLQVREGNPLARDIRELGIPVDFVPVPYLRHPLGIPRLLHYFRQNKIDLVHAQLEASYILGCIVARTLGIPTVSTLHTFPSPRPGTRSYWRARLMWWALRHFSQRVVAVSEAGRRYYTTVGHLPEKRVVTIYGGIDLDPFTTATGNGRAGLRASLGLPESAPVIITVAVLRKDKGIQFMLEALPRVLATVPEVRYLVVGGGPYEAELKKLAQNLENSERIIFTGMRTDIVNLLAISDVFVTPTLDDVLPTVLSEAMASNLPIVASAVGGIPEMVEHGRNGLLVPAADPDALAEACARLLQDRELRKSMGLAGREIVGGRFNVAVQAQRMGDLYEELITSSH